MIAEGRRDSPLLRWKKLSMLLLRMTDLKDRERFSRCSWRTKKHKGEAVCGMFLLRYKKLQRRGHQGTLHYQQEVLNSLQTLLRIHTNT